MTGLRSYQTAAVESALQALATAGSAIVQMPTGSGKTRAATAIVKSATGPIWFVCHRREIIRQAAKAFTAADITFGVVSPGHPFQPDVGVQILSVQTLVKRVADIPAPSLVIWDECHHVAAKSWATIRNALTGAKHLGLTATPERLDGKGLAEWFSVLIKGPTVRTLIDDGYLVPFRYFAPSEPDLTSAKLQAGDYRKVDIEKAMNIPVLIGDALAEYKKNLDGKRALVFASSVDASRSLAERFNAEGVPAIHVDGTTPSDVRDDAVEKLAAGDIKVLTNVEVFTEGVDIPAIDAVILLRPTKSPALFLQMVGRALRPAPGKTEAVIFDHAGLWLDHDLPSADFMWSLEGDAQKERLAAARANGGRKRRCPECKEVRVERVETCTCGYEFPTGREIGEYDGQLWELRGDVPEGFERKINFAERLGVTTTTISVWSQRGMPTVGGLVNIDGATEWVKSRFSTMLPPMDVDCRSDYESHTSFSERTGISKTSVKRLVDEGMPAASNGWVKVADAIDWLKQNPKSYIPPFNVEDPTRYERPIRFCERVGKPTSTVMKWIEAGLPISDNGWVYIDGAINWMNIHRPNHPHSANRPPIGLDGFISKSQFAKLIGATPGTVIKLTKRGLPEAKNGWIDPSAGLDWIKKNWKPRVAQPVDVEHPFHYESQQSFGVRIGARHGLTNEWRKRGLPCASNGWVHIQRGLEWVRDNTKIKIPPEAWPSANENVATSQADAA